jgi:hypothetical protein
MVVLAGVGRVSGSVPGEAYLDDPEAEGDWAEHRDGGSWKFGIQEMLKE